MNQTLESCLDYLDKEGKNIVREARDGNEKAKKIMEYYVMFHSEHRASEELVKLVEQWRLEQENR